MKAGLTCSGTRDPKQLVFRDESQTVVQKAIMSKFRQRQIDLPVDVRARNLFFSRYVTGNTRAFEYMQSFASDTSQHLEASIDAVSLAHFSVKANSSRIMDKARRKYVLALQLTNQILQVPEQATKDVTMLAILLLDLFEKIAKTTRRSSKFWTNHINGALALAILRGEQQFSNTTGLRMYLQLSASILICCVQHEIAVPADFVTLRNKASEYMNPLDPKYRLTETVVGFVQLRRAMKDGNLFGADVVAMARNLDADLNAISMTMPPYFQYHTVNTPSELGEVYRDFFHVYPNSRATHVWNLIRILRILVNETIVEQCLQVLVLDTAATLAEQWRGDQTRRSLEIIGQLAAEICAAAPQYTLWHRLPGNSPNSISRQLSGNSHGYRSEALQDYVSMHSSHNGLYGDMSDDELTAVQCTQCYSLIFPLYIAGRCATCTEQMRQWITNHLYFISSDTGIKEARSVANILERREEANWNPWSVYAMVGSYSFSA